METKSSLRHNIELFAVFTSSIPAYLKIVPSSTRNWPHKMPIHNVLNLECTAALSAQEINSQGHLLEVGLAGHKSVVRSLERQVSGTNSHKDSKHNDTRKGVILALQPWKLESAPRSCDRNEALNEPASMNATTIPMLRWWVLLTWSTHTHTHCEHTHTHTHAIHRTLSCSSQAKLAPLSFSICASFLRRKKQHKLD